jgi:hypothetical protein
MVAGLTRYYCNCKRKDTAMGQGAWRKVTGTCHAEELNQLQTKEYTSHIDHFTS